MKIRLSVILVLYGLIVNGQTRETVLSPEKSVNYYQLDNKSKQNLILELGINYSKSLISDTTYRIEIVDYLIDTIIINDEVNSSLAATLLLQHARLNEISFEQRKKLLGIYENGYSNVDLTQLIGLLGDKMFVDALNNIVINNKEILKKYEMDVLINALARLGDKNALDIKLNFFKAAYNNKGGTLNQDYAGQLQNVYYINRKEIYDLLFEFVENDRNKIIIIGSYGGDPYGADDNIYCTLSSFAMEILSQVIIDFPLKKVMCSNEKGNSNRKIVKRWYQNNLKYEFKLWHPYYGVNYSYWPNNKLHN